MVFKVHFPCIFPSFPCITSLVIFYRGKLMQYKVIRHMARKASSEEELKIYFTSVPGKNFH